MPGWDKIAWNADEHRSEPRKSFYQFSMSASDLKVLSGIYRRDVTDRSYARDDLGIQRRHEKHRSAEIKKYVTSGYPWSDLSDTQRRSGRFADLRQPGWLPTAIVVNILVKGDRREDKEIADSDLVEVTDRSTSEALLHLPEGFNDRWRYKSIPPIEVIDGQHRLWAFDDSMSNDFQVPVVAFVDLDLSWQAYLFYTINIKPKRINPSLAFDLYPLLRAEQWLLRFEGPLIYRETRAQELVDLLWATRESPWYRRINMLGDPGYRELHVTQAAWVRSLMASFVKKWEGQRIQIGGLFGTKLNDKPALAWDLNAQAAFLVLVGTELQAAIENSNDDWANQLRDAPTASEVPGRDAAFFGRHNLLNQDQGIRIFLQVANDLFFVAGNDIEFNIPALEYHDHDVDDAHDVPRVHSCLAAFRADPIRGRARQLGIALASYDWRASSAPGLNADQQALKQGFRGSGGYRQMREDVLRHLSGCEGWVAIAAHSVLYRLGYEEVASVVR